MLHISPQRVQICAALICFLCGIASGYAATAQEEAERKKRIDQLRKGVIRVTALKPGDVREVGAGIMIGERGTNIYFITAYHVIEDASDILIESYGKRGQQYKAKVFGERYDPVHDIAVLMVSNYEMPSDSLEQLYEIDLSKLQPGDQTIIIGHPPDKEWELVWTNLHSKSSTRLILKPGVVKSAHSGGPLLDTYGNLVGVVIGKTKKEYGEVVRIDKALPILDSWGVPYRTKLRVDFCAVLRRIIESSLQDLDDMKGAKTTSTHLEEEWWELNDRSLDITGKGCSKLARDYLVDSGKNTVYVAWFGMPRDETEGRRVWRQVAQAVHACLPDEELHQSREICWWTSYQEKWYMHEVWFIIHLGSVNGNVKLIIYRGREDYYDICSHPELFSFYFWEWPDHCR